MEAVSATAWSAQSKPIRFVECGCPAIDKGTNQPNLFFDAKSSDSGLPPFSTGGRDDTIQRSYLEAVHRYWHPDAGNNPTGSYDGPMIDAERMAVWAWDARPFPSFPIDRSAWGDAENWSQGHWISGRATAVSLADLLQALGQDYGFTDLDTAGLHGTVDGYVLDRVLSFRDAVQPLEVMFGFDMVETGTAIRAVSKQGLAPAITVSEDELVEGGGDGHILALTRRQETELPDVAKLRFIEGNADYRAAVAEARRVPGATARVAQAEVAVVLDQGRAEAAADSWLQDLWVAREQAGFTLPPSRLRIDPGDVVKLERASGSRILRIERVSELTSRTCEARAFDADVFASAYVAQRHGGALGGAVAPVTGPPAIGFLDLPRLRDQDPDWAGYVAAYAKPWPGAVHLYRSPQGSGYALNTVLQAPAAAGESLEAFAAGPTGRWDRGNRLVLRLYGGAAASLPELAVFGGGNLLAIETGEGRWEVLQFADAELVGPQSWALSMLLRGQFGSEGEMAASIAAGARCLILDGAVVPVAMQAADVGLPYHYRAGPAGDDIGADTYLTLEHAFSGTGLRPYSPAHLRGRREASGDILIQWVRRTRRGGDNWALAEVALAEEREAYVVEVLDGSDEVVRTLAVDEASVRYEAAQQAADFGTPANDFAVKVYQVSATYGRGTARREIIHV